MLQLLGAGLILMGSLGYACLFIEKENRVIKRMENWEIILQMFQSEITYKKQPLIFALDEISGKLTGEEGRYLKKIRDRMFENKNESFAKIWSKESEIYAKKEKLTKEEESLIKEFGIMTGFEDEMLQIKFIEEQEKKWQVLKGKRQKEHQERKRIVWTLGGSIGLILILILW